MRFKPSTNVKPFELISGPKPIPFIGNMWRYLPIIGDYKPSTQYENAQYNKKRYGTLVREKLSDTHTILHLFDPHDIEAFFRQDGRYPHRRSHRALLKYRRDRPETYIDGGLFPENGPHWHRQRNLFQKQLLSREFVGANIEKIEVTSLKAVENLKNFLGDKTSAIHEGFEDVLYHWAMSTTLSIFLDVDMDQVEPRVVKDLMNHLDKSLKATDITEIQTQKWIERPDKCPYYRQLVTSQDFLYQFTEKYVSERLREKPILSDDAQFSYLNEWLFKINMDKRDVISFVIDTLMAGLHTTPYTMTFLLYHISRNKVLLDSLRAEVLAALPRDQPVTIDDVDKLSMLRDCLKEVMRLNPIAIGTGRLTSHDNVRLRDYSIPSNTMIIAHTQTTSRDETIYVDAAKFKPDRWSKYRASPRNLRPSPFASLPFGLGARSCIGQRLAELQIKLLASRLLTNFDLTFLEEIKTKTTLIHTIDKPCRVSINKIVQ